MNRTDRRRSACRGFALTAIILSVVLFGASAQADELASPPLIVHFEQEWLCCLITNLSPYDFDVTIQVIQGTDGSVKETETLTLGGKETRSLCSNQVGGGLNSLAGRCMFYVPVESTTVKATATVCGYAGDAGDVYGCTHALEASRVPSFLQLEPWQPPWLR